MKHRLLAEFLGTFALVFSGTGAIMINEASGGVIGHAGIALTFGLIVPAMIYTFGDISGAHFNPAVTIAFAAGKRFPWAIGPRYFSAQLLGGIFASVVLLFLFPESETLGATVTAGSDGHSFLLEVILTAMLMLTILRVSEGAKEKGVTAGIAIGSVIALEAMFAGPISGASMNPVRSLAPALVSVHLESLWVYLLVSVIGALLAVPLCKAVRGRGCCGENFS